MRRIATLGVLVLAGCGGGSASGDTPVIVSAASSLTDALTTCRKDVPGVSPKLSFAGSDELAAQIRQGVKPDVYLAANTSLPDDLAKEGLLGKPVQFAANQLVLAVPAGSKIGTVGDLVKPGTSLVLGTKDVPFGSYTREVLARLPAGTDKAILANVRSEEPEVKSAVGKLTQGAADASFTYNTDVTAAGGKLKAIELPAKLQPTVAYGGGVVDGAPHAAAAQRYLDDVASGACQQALRKAGFGAPPGS